MINVKIIICKIKKHDWKFAYNYGVPLGCSKNLFEVLKDITFPVHRCSRCGKYDHESDGLNVHTEEGFNE